MKQLSYVLALSFIVAAAGCSHDPVCGNKVIEKGESCDKGDGVNGAQGSGCSATCQLQNIDTASVQIFYSRLKDEVPGFTSASCLGLGIKEAHVRLVGPTMVEETWPCDQNSETKTVDPGDYQAFITLYDMNGAALTKEVSSTTMTVASPGHIDLSINFAYADFLAPNYMGTYYFIPSWGTKGTRCAAGMVDKMQVTITPPGGSTPITAATTPTVPLDGTTTDCFTDSSSVSFIKVGPLATGHYDLKLVGLSATPAISYCKKFDIFVGPGAGTPTFDLVDDAATACP